MPLTIASAMARPRKNYGGTTEDRFGAASAGNPQGTRGSDPAGALGDGRKPPAPRSGRFPTTKRKRDFRRRRPSSIWRRLYGLRPMSCSASKRRRSSASMTTANRGGCGRDSRWFRHCRKEIRKWPASSGTGGIHSLVAATPLKECRARNITADERRERGGGKKEHGGHPSTPSLTLLRGRTPPNYLIASRQVEAGAGLASDIRPVSPSSNPAAVPPLLAAALRLRPGNEALCHPPGPAPAALLDYRQAMTAAARGHHRA